MDRIKVGLFGFGKTGRIVAGELLEDSLFDLCWVVRRTSPLKIQYASRLLGYDFDSARIFGKNNLLKHFFKENKVDIIIDFSTSQGYTEYTLAVNEGIRIISAISKYTPKAIATLQEYAKTTAVLYSPNITLGINFLMVASQVLQKIAPHADIEIVEEHFRDKKETSGTALKIAKVLGLEKDIHVNSIRVGGIVGKHEIIFGLKNQTIRLTHESINKAAFGQGAIFAAKWLINKDTGFYSMEEIITEMIEKNLPVY
jgi:4-hydroxy-tetrahydrodipicolinate reductase